MRLTVGTALATLAVALLYVAWVFGGRYAENQRLEQENAAKRPGAPHWGTEVRILGFYATSGELARDEKALLCYGVANARSVRIDPPIDELWPTPSRCLDISPGRTTRYTLTAEGKDGRRVTQSLEILVRAR